MEVQQVYNERQRWDKPQSTSSLNEYKKCQIYRLDLHTVQNIFYIEKKEKIQI